MNFLFRFLFSSKFTAVLLFIFGYAIAAATFIENEYGTPTANIEIFRSKWLEVVMVLLAINFLGNIKKYNMISQKKWPSLVFHLAFVIIIIGAGVTRYFGFEGSMPIREGATSSTMYSAEPHLMLKVLDPNLDPQNPRSHLGYTQPHLMAATTNNDFKINFGMENQNVEFSYVDYIENADYQLHENIKGGTDILEVVTTQDGVRKSVYVESGNAETVGNTVVAFNAPEVVGAVSVIEVEKDSFQIMSPVVIPRMRMIDQSTDTVKPGVVSKMYFRQLHMVNNTQIVFARRIQNGVKQLTTMSQPTTHGDALKIRIVIGEDTTERVLFGGPARLGVTDQFEYKGLYFKASYGSIPIKLPFSIRLEDFIMQTYPGSTNPSGYLSKVTLLDKSDTLNPIAESHEIFMNNVLDHGGYRFFQSSFDKDHKGTVLSVNHDAAGTNITYIGYFLLGLGFVLTLMNKNSRFFGLPKKVKALREKRLGLAVKNIAKAKQGLTVLLLFLSLGLYSQDSDGGHTHADGTHHDQAHTVEEQKHDQGRGAHTKTATAPLLVPIEQAEKFGQLIVQSAEGRFEPVNTLALDLVHKISRSNTIVVDSVEFTPEQFMLELMVNGTYFEDKRIIKVSDDSIRNFLGVNEGKYVSYLDFFAKNANASKIKEPLLKALQTDPKKRNRWSKEVIKVADKLESWNLAQRGDLLRLFPSMDSTANNSWVNMWSDPAKIALEDLLKNKMSKISASPDDSYGWMFRKYWYALKFKSYVKADSVLNEIAVLQRALVEEDILPSKEKIEKEISYNQSSIFDNIKKGYMYLSVFLLLFALIESLVSNRESEAYKYVIKAPLILCSWIFAALFAYHTYGLGLRWYLTGHAPWSNGYEALVFIAWGTALSGLIFSRLSKITLAGTAFVAFLIIMTAGHENMDPQLTNLVPVLKSYWLVIHVACITTSYGFFALGGVLGLIVMFIMAFKSRKSTQRIDLLTQELTFINEMTVTIGIILAAVGTFLGGVWANESWGRYWGWDAKETWALVIVITYAILLHFRFIPGFIRSKFFFNAFGTVFGFGSVCMTFFGVNFYFSNSIHSYAAGDPPAFPIWLWVIIGSILALCLVAGFRESQSEKRLRLEKK